ncbi:MAG: FemAB family PEP-CTERM system-associated protein [Bryobacterales bacterium]|nr:FemAB family PEP-CTERM system-associated protein [Bryobacterales bacterium]
MSNLLTGKILVSTPFAVYGGALTNDEESAAALAAFVRQLGTQLGVQYVELRNQHAGQKLGFQDLARYVTFYQRVGGGSDQILESIPRKTRRMVRKSIDAGFATEVETASPGEFEDLYLKNLHRLGTPAFPSAHFRNILHHFKGSVGIHHYRLGDRLASSVLTFYFRDTVLPYYGASDPACNASAPNNFMYYDIMLWASTNGYSVFDFGRSKKDVGGSYDFKSHWGMEEVPLPYEILLVRRRDLPNFSPANPAFSLPQRIWVKLPPKLTRWLGPRLIRMLP